MVVTVSTRILAAGTVLAASMSTGGAQQPGILMDVKIALKISDDAIALESGFCVLHSAACELLDDSHIERLFRGSQRDCQGDCALRGMKPALRKLLLMVPGRR